ncbi:hypothetical protein TRFO_14882 [Tritrichomonas foetus]|uniref:RRM domain-containing protein n=1 Tax=Tritrichomonas foetus TaxID=1144522 RepID=A0A1J4KTV8_9EUKA|nr:hypothetical protein TRFO_14882 [Tritrichomonas foetus]|eukprot:OHT14699.1 hypothetical protein TRFO_14882 [Tritrichomonas foetus]
MSATNNPATTALYASELPNSTTEEQLQEFFNNYGNVKHVKIFTRTTTKSAKISFSTKEEAEKVLKETSGLKFLDKPFKITWNVDRTRNNDSSIVVNNLPQSTEGTPLLKNVLQKFGAVTNIRFIKSNNNNNPNGNQNNNSQNDTRAIVYFQTSQSAQAALHDHSWCHLLGPKVTVTATVSGGPRQGGPSSAGPVELAVLPPYLLYSHDDDNCLKSSESYAILKIQPGFLAFYNTPEIALQVAAASNGKATGKVTSDIFFQALREIEKRTVFVGCLSGTSEAEVAAFFEQAGPIASLRFNARTATIQFKTIEDREKAIKFNRQIFGQQVKPIIVTPYFDHNLQQSQCGLLQFNELPASTKIDDLAGEFSQYGEVLTASICPNALGQNPTGFVLFSKYEDAVKAKTTNTNYINVFLYPGLHPSEAVGFFLDSNTAPNNCLAIYDVTDKNILEELRGYGYVLTSFIISNTAFAYFSVESTAVEAYKALKEKGKTVELLSGNVLIAAFNSLRNIALPIEWQYSFLYVTSLPGEIGNKDLRTILTERLGCQIDSCFIGLAPASGLSSETAAVLCSSMQFAQLAGNLASYAQGSKVQLFMSRLGYTAHAPPQKYRLPTTPGANNSGARSYGAMNQQPQIGGRQQQQIAPREWIKQFVLLNFAAQEENLRSTIDNLTVNQAYQLTRDFSTFTAWIEGLVAKINA